MAIYVRNEQGELKPLEIPAIKGENGVTPNIQIGEVTTLDSEEQATVTNTGSLENPIFNFGIPRGRDGGGNSTSIDDSVVANDKTWSSSKIEDFTLANDGVVWLDVNGENVKVDSTKEGYLREIEIFGNTIQNQEDLSDIKHVGELYLDEQEQPILDNLGREQYKVEIESYNDNLFDINILKYTDSSKIANIKDGTITLIGKSRFDSISFTIPVTPNKKYFLSMNWDSNSIISSERCFQIEQNGANILRTNVSGRVGTLSKGFFTPTTNSVDIRLYGCGDAREYITTISNIFLTTDVEKPYVPPKSHKRTILLPCQLMKVGDVADRLYWDNEKGRYVIEKNISSDFIDGSEPIVLKSNSATGSSHPIFTIEKQSTFPKKYGFITNTRFKSYGYNGIHDHADRYGLCWANGSEIYKLLVIRTEEVFLNVNDFRNFLKENTFKFYYDTATPQLIETNITEQIKLPTYINTTYITVNGGISGSIKAKAPVDSSSTLNTLVKESYMLQQENARLKEINVEQDKLIDISLLAKEELFKRLEPLLVESLNVKNVNVLLSMYVAMVQRGLKKIEEIPERYREQVKEIVEN